MDQTDQCTLKFCVESSNFDVPLGVHILFDQEIIHKTSSVTRKIEIQHSFSEDDSKHELAIELFGKNIEHTKVDEQGKIVSDVLLTVDGVKIDDIEINQLFQELATYTHNFNGTQDCVQEKFFGVMGCNGVVKLEFATPVYLWLLESM